MDELMEQYQNLKISAYDKLNKVNKYIHNVTLGPNSSYRDEPDRIDEVHETQKRTKFKPKPNTYVRPPVSDLRILLKMKELERLKQTQELIAQKQKLFVEQQKMCENRMRERWLEKQKELMLQVEHQEMQIFQAEEEHDKNSLLQNEQRQRYYQELEEKRRKRDLELQAKEQMKRNLECMNKISKNQHEIGLLYQDILNILKTTVLDENIKKPIGEISQKLKMLILEMEEITKKCKSSVTNVEVQKSADLLAQMVVLKDEVQRVINDYNKQKEIKLKEQQNKLVKEMQPNLSVAMPIPKQEPSIPETATTVTKIDKFVSKPSFRIYSEMQEFLINHQKTYADLLANESLKQFKFDCKKAVNIPVNAISAVNAHHLQDKYIKLSNLLAGKPVPVGESQMSAAKHPQGIAFCMDLLAKKFILQGDLMISSNPEAAFCYGTMILSLWNEYPDFGKLLLAYFHRQCPYLVPIHLPKAVGQTNEDYYKSLGYQYVDGVVEKQDKFLKRMTGIMRLYSAIIISKPKKSQKEVNPHGLNQGWRWLTATLNLEPKTDITATLIHVFLETVGCTMQNVYKNEFKKIIAFIITIYMPMLKKIDSGGPYTRLEVLLQEYQAKGQFSEPSGMLPVTYW